MDLQNITKQIRQNKYLNPIVTVVGVFFIFLGLLGLVLPVIPGIVFLVIGIIILGEEFFLTRWIIKKSPKAVRDRLQKRKEGNGDKLGKSKKDSMKVTFKRSF